MASQVVSATPAISTIPSSSSGSSQEDTQITTSIFDVLNTVNEIESVQNEDKCELDEANTYKNILQDMSDSVSKVKSIVDSEKPVKNVIDEQKSEDPDSCIVNDNDSYNKKTIKSGEICTIQTAKEYGIFGKNSYFNSLLPSDEADKTDILMDNIPTKGSEYSLCSVKNNKAFQNCVLTTKNPWKTLNASETSCMIATDIKFPELLKFNKDTKLIEKPKGISIFKNKSDYCQEKWYDWFSIPDYHFGNAYIAYGIDSTGNPTKPYDGKGEFKCYKPCKMGYIPTKQNGGLFSTPGPVNDRCIAKDKYDLGFYASSFYYLPVPLIVLLGSTKTTLLKKHDETMAFIRTKFQGLAADFDLYTNIVTDEVTKNNIYKDIKNDLQFHITNLFSIPFDESNIIVPDSHSQNLANSPGIELNSRDRIQYAYDIAKTFYDLSMATDKESMKKFLQWKKEVSDISGFDINDNKFFKQLLILKKACNVAFDNRSSYSRDVIMYILNKDRPNDEVRLPISFDITATDITLSKSNNPAENTVEKDAISVEDVTKLLKDENDKNKKLAESVAKKVEMQAPDGSFTKYDEYKPSTFSKDDQNKIDVGKTVILTLSFIILAILFCTILFMVLNIFWTPITAIVNEIILGFTYIISLFLYMFAGEYSPSTFELSFLKMQEDFLTYKINRDKMAYGI